MQHWEQWRPGRRGGRCDGQKSRQNTHTQSILPIPNEDAKFDPMTFTTFWLCGKNSETQRGIHDPRHISEKQNWKIFVLLQEFNQ